MSQEPQKLCGLPEQLDPSASFQAALRSQSWYLAGGIFRACVKGQTLARIAINIRRLRMTEEEEIELKAQLERLRQEHRDLDAAIEALQAVPGADVIQVQRLKKRKLILRDRITFIEDQLTPDIIA
jgi:hypothetical protein